MLEKDYKELELIQKDIESFENKKVELQTTINTIDTEINALEHSISLIISTSDTSKLKEIKKLKDKLKGIKEDREQIVEMLQVLESNFKDKLKADLRELLYENNNRRLLEFRKFQEEQRTEFDELTKKQWNVYKTLESTANEYKEFNRNLLNMWGYYGLEEDKKISNIVRYDSNYQGGVTSLYDFQSLTFKGFVPSVEIERRYFDN